MPLVFTEPLCPSFALAGYRGAEILRSQRGTGVLDVCASVGCGMQTLQKGVEIVTDEERRRDV